MVAKCAASDTVIYYIVLLTTAILSCQDPAPIFKSVPVEQQQQKFTIPFTVAAQTEDIERDQTGGLIDLSRVLLFYDKGTPFIIRSYALYTQIYTLTNANINNKKYGLISIKSYILSKLRNENFHSVYLLTYIQILLLILIILPYLLLYSLDIQLEYE